MIPSPWSTYGCLSGLLLLLNTAAICNAVEATPGNVSSVKRYASITSSIPFFTNPQSGSLPAGFIGKTDSCLIDSVFADSVGSGWFLIETGTIKGWVRPQGIQFESEYVNDTIIQSQANTDDDTDRKRRYRIVRENASWPRRIIAAVREGRICLGMNNTQVVAAWGQPFETARAFTFGIGEYDVWYFKGRTGRLLCVNIAGGRVVGWSINR